MNKDSIVVDQDYEVFAAVEALNNLFTSHSSSLSCSDIKTFNGAVETLTELSIKDRVSKVDNDITNKEVLLSISVESIKENVKNVLNKIMEYIKNAFLWIVDTLDKYKGSYKKYHEKAVLIKEEALKLASNTPKAGYIDNQALASFFSHKGKTYSGKEIISIYKSHQHDLSETMVLSYIKDTLSHLTLISNKLTDSYTEEQLLIDIDQIYKKLFSGPLSFLENDSQKSQDDILVKSYDFQFGNKTLYANCLLQNDLIKNVKIDIRSDENTSEPDSKIITLSISEINTITSSIEHDMLNGNYKQYDKVIDGIKKIEKQVNKAIDKIVNDQAKGKTNNTYPVYFLKNIVGSFVHLITVLRNQERIIIKALLSYCEKSLSMYR